MNIATVRALGMGLVLAAPGVVFAQDAPPPPPPSAAPPMASGGAHHWGHGPMALGDWSPEKRRLKALHDILGVTPDQEGAFQAYASALHPRRPAAMAGGPGAEGPGASEHNWPDPKALAAMTTPERLDVMAKRMEAREAKMRERFARMAAATKTFYAALTPEQKRIMDSLPELRQGEGHGWGHGGMGHMHGGPGPMAPTPGAGE